MPLDPYSPCPGGTGKKIKFCCADLVHDLDKLQRMVDGEQRIAALDYVTKLDAKYPGRACLLSARSLLETMLGKREEAAATVAAFREQSPDNPQALAHDALLHAGGERPVEAIRPLLLAIGASAEEMTKNVYDAIGMVAQALIDSGDFVPARALLTLQVNISQGTDQEALSRWLAFDGEPRIPLLFKDHDDLSPAPDGAPWKFEFNVALDCAMKLNWPLAAEKFTALAPLAAKSPALWRNLAFLRGRLGDNAGAIEALRKLAALDVPSDDAAEADAKALMLEFYESGKSGAAPPPSPADRMRLTLGVMDHSALVQRLAASKQVELLQIDPVLWNNWNESADESAPTDQPAPRAIYMLLDRAVPPVEGLTREQLPLVLGTFGLFGRETDRAERLELEGSRADLAAAKSLLLEVGGNALGEPGKEAVAAAHPDSLASLSWQWRFPDGVSNERRRALLAEERRRRLLEVWPETPEPRLGGRTPRAAAADPAMRSRLLGEILVIELNDSPNNDAEVFNDLRRALRLPTSDPIDPTTTDMRNLPATRLGRVLVDKLNDEMLVSLFHRASILGLRRPLARLAAEVVRRPALAARVDMAQAHGILAANATDLTEALREVELARAAALRAKQSSARWDLEELNLRIHRGESAEATRLVQHLRDEHSREPGVSEMLFRILYEAGIIDEQGRQVAPPQRETSPILMPGRAEPGKLLVPGGEEPAAAGQAGSKPVIWTPGME